MSVRIKAIIFDLGNVLVSFDTMRAVSRISAFTDKNPEQISSLVFGSVKLLKFFEEGRVRPHEFFLKIKKTLRLSLSYKAFKPIWNEIFFLTEDNVSTAQIAARLRQDYKVAVLTNTNILHFEYIKKQFEIFDIFPHIVTSFETGLTKPHPQIYAQTMSVLGVIPSEAFYLDDRADLVAKARTLGIRAFVYQGTAQLIKDLAVCGITIEEIKG
ncbi:MAG: HAD family phosphatase [Candidatus Omnitrophota bacterium]|jgi:putative hydrolase of the HAD superfamily